MTESNIQFLGTEFSSDSPLALPFEQALQPSVFLTRLKQSAENQARREFGDLGNDALKAGIAAAKFVLDKKGVTVVFEGGIPKGAKLMKDAAGKLLPKLVDGKTGRIIKTGRIATSTGRVAKLTADAALAVVEVAHLISGHDNAKRLKKVERGINALQHAHESELKSRLESIYRYSKELLHGDFNQLSDRDQQELHRQCRDLIELRARWRDDFRFQLSQIKSAEPGWINQILFWQKDDALRASRENRAAEAHNTLEIVQMMHFSFMLQMTLAGAAGRLEAFQKCTLKDECHSWKMLLEHAATRATEICGNDEAHELRQFLNAMTELVQFWSPEQWEDFRKRTIKDHPAAQPSDEADDLLDNSLQYRFRMMWASMSRNIGGFRDKKD